MAWTRFPHTFTVSKIDTGDTYPPSSTLIEIMSGECSVQTKSELNENSALVYDFILYTKEVFPEPILATYQIECIVGTKTITGEVVRGFEGQITNRIWFKEISN